ncbi:hypothetical protein MMC27_008796 [Xylographa pallens]|nr:hypothetical protein [Xylographa pallens]
MIWNIKRLGLAAGFKNGLTSYAFRRAAGFYLDLHLTPEHRRAHMGYIPISDAFSSYRSSTSQFHLQFARLGLPVQNVTMFSGCAFGKMSGAPTTLSGQAFLRVGQNPVVLKMQNKIVPVLDYLLTVNTTIDNAKAQNSAQFREYTRLIKERD